MEPLLEYCFAAALCVTGMHASTSLVYVRAFSFQGESDMNPVSAVSKISQVAFAAVSGSIPGNLMAGAIAQAGAVRAGDGLEVRG